jgi:T-complex protein 1 subunit zeta
VLLRVHSNVVYLQGLHPRLITDGFDKAKDIALKVLDDMKYTGKLDRALLIQVARTALRTKLHEKLADHITEVSVLAFSISHYF